MLQRYKRRANVAAGIYLASLVGLIATIDPTKGSIFSPDDVFPRAILAIHVISFFGALWAYAKAKGYSGLIGIILAVFNVMGLLVLLMLKDRHPGGVSPSRSGKIHFPPGPERIEPTLSVSLDPTKADPPQARKYDDTGVEPAPLKPLRKQNSLLSRARGLLQRIAPGGLGDRAISLHNNGVLAMNEGRYEEAETGFKRALQIFHDQAWMDSPAASKSLESLARLYDIQNRRSEAKTYYQQAIELLERGMGSNHVRLAPLLSSLGFLYVTDQNYAQAASVFQRALTITENTLGPTHASVGIYVSNLAYVYEIQSNYARAEALNDRALSIWKRGGDSDAVDTAQKLNKVASFYFAQNEYRQAELLYKRAIALAETSENPDPETSSRSREGIAEINRTFGQGAKSESTGDKIISAQANSKSMSTVQVLGASESRRWALSHFDVTADTEDKHLTVLIRTLQELAAEEGYEFDTEAVIEMYQRRRGLMRPSV